MNDIEILVPFSSSQHFLRRFTDFKKYGLLNIGKKKVVLKMVTAKNDHLDALTDWPNELKVNHIVCPYENLSPEAAVNKIYYYYSELTESDIDQARWFARFDDDSMTDIDRLVDNLDIEFDYKKEHYIGAEAWPDLLNHHVERNLLEKFGYSRWIERGYNMRHEIEGCVVSQATMREIVRNKTAMQFLKERREITDGYGDAALACAAYMCKIPITDSYFMTKDPKIHNFSMFGKYINHIHFVANDVNKKLFDFAIKMLNNKSYQTPLGLEICKYQYLFYYGELKSTNAIKSIVKFNPLGAIEQSNSDDPNESFWLIENDKLYFLNEKGDITINFQNKNHEKFVGQSSQNHEKFTLQIIS